MNPYRNTKQPPVKKAPAAPKAPVIRKPNIKSPTATQVLMNGTPGDNQNFNK